MRLRVGVISAVLLLLAGIAPAEPTSRPAENLIHRSSSAGSATSSSTTTGGGWQVALSLAAVLGLIVILYWVSRRILPNGAFASSSSRAVHVLARTNLSPRHRVTLLQVGRRILVVGESAGQLTTLCQITDPDEAAALIGQLGGDQGRSLAALLDKGTNPPKPATDDSELAVTRQELDSLMQQVRTMAQQIGRA